MRWYYRLATVINPIFLLIIRSFPPARPRVRVLVYNLEGKILLVKSAFGMREWELPGGAAHYRESQEAAAARELYEETSVKVVAAMLRKKETRRAPFSDGSF